MCQKEKGLVRPRLMLYVIMDFIFYFGIGFGTAFSAYHMFAIDVICEFRHTHPVQTFVLKAQKPRVGNSLTI
jgi:hypothetical protein